MKLIIMRIKTLRTKSAAKLKATNTMFRLETANLPLPATSERAKL